MVALRAQVWYCCELGLGVVGSRSRQVELCHTAATMLTKRPHQPKNHQCMQCMRWYTAKSIGNHIQNCMKWDDHNNAFHSPSPSERCKASDNDSLMDDLSHSDDNTSSQSDNQPEDPTEPPSPPAFVDFEMGFDNSLTQDDGLADSYQNEHIYNSDKDDDWWNELCVPEPEQFVELGAEDMEDFEELLNWIDNEFDLEVAQNGEWCTCCFPFLWLISLLVSSLLTVEDKQNIRMFVR
jgi:hypothetical protein